MPSQQNLETVKTITDNLQKAKAVIIADYSGLNVATQTELRQKIDAVGGSFAVTKNRLFKLAVKEKLGDVPANLDQALNGPNAILYGFDDPVAATKALVDFAKDHENLEIKIGILAGTDGQTDKVMSLDDIKNLATLPSREQLLGQVVGTLNAPVVGFVNVLAANIRGLVTALKAIQDQKSN